MHSHHYFVYHLSLSPSNSHSLPPVNQQIRGLRRTTEICDLRESLLPDHGIGIRGLSAAMLGVTLSDEAG